MGLTYVELRIKIDKRRKGDSNLLGSLTLETFGLVLDPLGRRLKAMPMLLMESRTTAEGT